MSRRRPSARSGSSRFWPPCTSWSQAGGQFIIATHSPIILAYPQASILQFTASGIAPVAYQDTEHYKVTKAFLTRTERCSRSFSPGCLTCWTTDLRRVDLLNLLPTAPRLPRADPTPDPDRMNRPSSHAIFARAQQLMPGGVNSPARAFGGVGGEPVVFERAKGRISSMSMATATSTTSARGGR